MNERVTAIISTAQTTESFDTRFLSDFFPLFLSFFFFPPPLSSSSWSCPLFMNIPATITKRPLSFAGEYSDAVASFEWRRTNARASKVSLSLSLSCGKCETWWERQDLSRVVEMTERQRMWNRDGDVFVLCKVCVWIRGNGNVFRDDSNLKNRPIFNRWWI